MIFKKEQLLTLLLDNTNSPEKLENLEACFQFTYQCLQIVDNFNIQMETSPFFNSNPYAD